MNPNANGGPNPALSAVHAGLAMLDEMDRLKPYLDTVYGRTFDVGIGINYGHVIVGSVGADDLMRVTVIGDVVHVAGRIESANRSTGTRLLISSSTLEQVAPYVTVGRELGVQLKGKTGDFLLHEITGLTPAGV